MSPVSLLLSLFAVDFLAVVSPGPAFVIVTRIAARRGSRAGLAATLGILVAAMFWCGAVLSGLSVLFRLFPWVYLAVKIGGGLYLAYVGFLLLKGGTPAPAADGRGEPPADRSFRKGLFVGLTNAKAVVYFSSIFSLFLKPGSPLWLQLAAAGIVAFDTAVWYSLVAALFSRHRVRRAYDRLQRWVERIAGTVMLAFGARLILTKD